MRSIINNKKGFSLVELIIVIAIMAILSAAITPAVIRYIEKARKARDVEVAQTIVDAAGLAMTTSEDNAYYGWTACVDFYKNTNYPATVLANEDGSPADWNIAWNKKPGKGQYTIRPVAWCRGVRYNITYGKTAEWQNTLFKSTLDDTGEIGTSQRDYTNEFLWCLSQEMATGGTDKGNRNYDGETDLNMSIKYNKPLDCKAGPYKGQKVQPELWIVYRRDDTGAAEVWTGYKKSGSNIAPLYRVYPSPSKEYR